MAMSEHMQVPIHQEDDGFTVVAFASASRNKTDKRRKNKQQFKDFAKNDLNGIVEAFLVTCRAKYIKAQPQGNMSDDIYEKAVSFAVSTAMRKRFPCPKCREEAAKGADMSHGGCIDTTRELYDIHLQNAAERSEFDSTVPIGAVVQEVHAELPVATVMEAEVETKKDEIAARAEASFIKREKAVAPPKKNVGVSNAFAALLISSESEGEEQQVPSTPPQVKKPIVAPDAPRKKSSSSKKLDFNLE